MKRIALILLLCLIAPAAHAADAYTTTKINLRAGPDGGYPVVEVLKRGERVELLGCINGLQWCEVETRQGEHGWVYAHYLNTSYRGQTVTIIQNGANTRIITFRPNYYWDTYYRNKYFYRDRYTWIPRDSGNHNHHHDHDDDRDRTRPVAKPKPEAEPKYKPLEMPSRKEYNPLCPMGQNEC